ncbi:MAG: hypothetical protein ACK4SY_07665 [Pyrobaculum sp.]
MTRATKRRKEKKEDREPDIPPGILLNVDYEDPYTLSHTFHLARHLQRHGVSLGRLTTPELADVLFSHYRGPELGEERDYTKFYERLIEHIKSKEFEKLLEETKYDYPKARDIAAKFIIRHMAEELARDLSKMLNWLSKVDERFKGYMEDLSKLLKAIREKPLDAPLEEHAALYRPIRQMYDMMLNELNRYQQEASQRLEELRREGMRMLEGAPEHIKARYLAHLTKRAYDYAGNISSDYRSTIVGAMDGLRYNLTEATNLARAGDVDNVSQSIDRALKNTQSITSASSDIAKQMEDLETMVERLRREAERLLPEATGEIRESLEAIRKRLQELRNEMLAIGNRASQFSNELEGIKQTLQQNQAPSDTVSQLRGVGRRASRQLEKAVDRTKKDLADIRDQIATVWNRLLDMENQYKKQARRRLRAQRHMQQGGGQQMQDIQRQIEELRRRLQQMQQGMQQAAGQPQHAQRVGESTTRRRRRGGVQMEDTCPGGVCPLGQAGGREADGRAGGGQGRAGEDQQQSPRVGQHGGQQADAVQALSQLLQDIENALRRGGQGLQDLLQRLRQLEGSLPEDLRRQVRELAEQIQRQMERQAGESLRQLADQISSLRHGLERATRGARRLSEEVERMRMGEVDVQQLAEDLRQLFGGLSAGIQAAALILSERDAAERKRLVERLKKFIKLASKGASIYEEIKKADRLGVPGGVTKMTSLSQLLYMTPTSRAIAQASPELFKYKLATKSLTVKELHIEERDRYYVLIDRSGSMAEEYAGVPAISWATALVYAIMAHGKPEKMTVRFFDAQVHDPIKDKREIVRYLLTAMPEGGTSINDALKVAIKEAKKDYKLILVTDGYDIVDPELLEEAKKAFREVKAIIIGGDNKTIEKNVPTVKIKEPTEENLREALKNL